MSNFDQYDDVENPILVLKAGEDFNFYANLDILEDDATFSDWHLDLVFEDFSVALPDIGTLQQDIISGTDYRFYSSFVVPTGITAGCYRLIVVDEFYNTVKYISNKITFSEDTDYTNIVRFRNSKNIYNFNYETLTAFYNRFRIKIQERHPTPQTNSTGYDLIEGAFNPIRTTTGQVKEFITLWYDKDDHMAFSSATTHGVFEAVEDGEFKRFIRASEEYVVDWNNNYPLSEGSIRLQRRDSFSSNKTL